VRVEGVDELVLLLVEPARRPLGGQLLGRHLEGLPLDAVQLPRREGDHVLVAGGGGHLQRRLELGGRNRLGRRHRLRPLLSEICEYQMQSGWTVNDSQVLITVYPWVFSFI
jgi:hypothetical protein